MTSVQLFLIAVVIWVAPHVEKDTAFGWAAVCVFFAMWALLQMSLK